MSPAAIVRLVTSWLGRKSGQPEHLGTVASCLFDHRHGKGIRLIADANPKKRLAVDTKLRRVKPKDFHFLKGACGMNSTRDKLRIILLHLHYSPLHAIYIGPESKP